MRINKIYLEASFISFLIHASIILYLLGYFYFEAKERSILSRPIEVNLVFKDEVLMKSNVNQIQEILNSFCEEYKLYVLYYVLYIYKYIDVCMTIKCVRYKSTFKNQNIVVVWK